MPGLGSTQGFRQIFYRDIAGRRAFLHSILTNYAIILNN